MTRALASAISGIGLLVPPTSYANDSSAAHDRVICTSGGVTREIVTWRGDGVAGECHVDYTKDGVTATLWSAHHDPTYCTRNAQELERKLSGAGFACTATDSATRAQNLLPGGFLVRPVQKEDLQLVRALCPRAQWRDLVFTCYRNEWAPWAQTLETAAIPPDQLEAYKAFVSGPGFVSMPTDGLVVFPDLSSHLILDGFNKDTGESAVWLIDPLSKTVDLIWVAPDATTYVGPNATLLMANHLDTDSFKIGAAGVSAASETRSP